MSYLSKHFDVVPVTFPQGSCHSPHLQMRSSRLRKVKQLAQGLAASVSGSLEPSLLLPKVRFFPLQAKAGIFPKLEHRTVRSLQHHLRFLGGGDRAIDRRPKSKGIEIPSPFGQDRPGPKVRPGPLLAATSGSTILSHRTRGTLLWLLRDNRLHP